MVCEWSHTVLWSYYTTTARLLPHVVLSFFVPAQVVAPVMLLYPHSEQLTPSTGLFGIEAAISEQGLTVWSKRLGILGRMLAYTC